MRYRYLTALPLLGLAFAATAEDYRCTQGELVRRIEIIYEPGRALPCEVHYYKDTEAPGTSQVLWRAENEAGYCEARVAELTERLGGYGWSCTAAAAADDGEDAENRSEPDDTDALAPAEDDTGDN